MLKNKRRIQIVLLILLLPSLFFHQPLGASHIAHAHENDVIYEIVVTETNETYIYGAEYIISGGGSYLEGYFNITCRTCGTANPQWFDLKNLQPCSSCGNLGMSSYVGTSLPSLPTLPQGGYVDPDPPSPPTYYPPYAEEEEDDIPMIVVIGGGALVGIAVAKIIKGATGKGKKAKGQETSKNPVKTNQEGKKDKKDKKKDKDETLAYIINLSEDNILLRKGDKKAIEIRVLKVYPDGRTEPEGSAIISLSSLGPSSIQILPARGTGQMTTTLSLKEEGKNQEEIIRVSARIKGEEKTVDIRVRFEEAMEVVFF